LAETEMKDQEAEFVSLILWSLSGKTLADETTSNSNNNSKEIPQEWFTGLKLQTKRFLEESQASLPIVLIAILYFARQAHNEREDCYRSFISGSSMLM
jgi:hypothetical protein